MASCSSHQQQLEKDVKRLRKKLKQIENLERLDRELNREELDKLSRKQAIRKQISEKLQIIKELSQENFNHTTTTTNQSNESTQNGSSFNSFWQKSVNETADVPNSSEIEEQSQASATSEEPHLQTTTDDFSVNYGDLDISESPHVLRSHDSEDSSQKTSTPKSKMEPDKVHPGDDTSHDSVTPVEDVVRKKPKNKKKAKESPTSKPAQQSSTTWQDREFTVTTLEGHFDVVCCLDTNGTILFSGSRDTTVKVWSLHTLKERHSMGGHTAAVTCVRILPRGEEVQGLDDSLDPTRTAPPTQIGISGSLDAHINIWDLDVGQKVGHIYTFSSVTCMEYSNKRIITGTDGGKIEIWNVDTKLSLGVIRGPERGITCMYLEGCRLYCGDSGGTVQVWTIPDLDKPKDELALPEKPDVKWNAAEVEEEEVFYPRCVRCVVAHGDHAYWGDDGTNVKVLDCSTGCVHRLTNHMQRFGSTGGMTVWKEDGLLLATGYDLDSGNASINVRRLSGESYVCSLVSAGDQPTPYISCIIATKQTNPRNDKMALRICTGGNELKIWDMVPAGRSGRLLPSQTLARCVHEEHFNSSYYTDTESEGGDSDMEERSPTIMHTRPLPQAIRQHRENIEVVEERQSWLWWLCKCNIL